MSPIGPKRRLEDVCYSATVRGKHTHGELPETMLMTRSGRAAPQSFHGLLGRK
jgi:hypothetical protein